jgi:hypothetical protein
MVTEDMQPLPLEAAQQGLTLTLTPAGCGRAEEIVVSPLEGAPLITLKWCQAALTCY